MGVVSRKNVDGAGYFLFPLGLKEVHCLFVLKAPFSGFSLVKASPYIHDGNTRQTFPR